MHKHESSSKMGNIKIEALTHEEYLRLIYYSITREYDRRFKESLKVRLSNSSKTVFKKEQIQFKKAIGEVFKTLTEAGITTEF